MPKLAPRPLPVDTSSGQVFLGANPVLRTAPPIEVQVLSLVGSRKDRSFLGFCTAIHTFSARHGPATAQHIRCIDRNAPHGRPCLFLDLLFAIPSSAPSCERKSRLYGFFEFIVGRSCVRVRTPERQRLVIHGLVNFAEQFLDGHWQIRKRRGNLSFPPRTVPPRHHRRLLCNILRS